MLKKFYMDHNKIYRISIRNLFNSNRYYIIRRHPLGAGFFSNYIYVLTHIMYAQSKGFIPVVDMEHYKTLYNEEQLVNGTNNAWEYYFTQPNNIRLEDAYESKNYILSNYSLYHEYIPYNEVGDRYAIDNEKLHALHQMVIKSIALQPALQSELDAYKKQYFTDGKVLGVHYRGTDKHCMNEGHYISPDLRLFLELTANKIKKHNIKRIFLCTDEMSAIDAFCRAFPHLVFYTNAYRAEQNTVKGLHLQQNSDGCRSAHKYQLGKEVLYDTYLLSKCNYLLHAHSNIINAATILNDDSFEERDLVHL